MLIVNKLQARNDVIVDTVLSESWLSNVESDIREQGSLPLIQALKLLFPAEFSRQVSRPANHSESDLNDVWGALVTDETPPKKRMM